MKKIFIFILLYTLSGCYGSNISSEFNYDDENILPSENYIISGSNQITYDKSKQLHTLVYHAGDKYGVYTSTAGYTLSQNNNTFAKESVSANFKSSVEPVSEKEKLNEYIRNFQLYAENAGLNPIEKKSSVLYKTTAPQSVSVGTKWDNVYVLNVNNETYKTINTTCIAVSNHAYFFMEDGLAAISDEKIQAITQAFDKDYEIIHQYYGTETDTDGNGKVSFIIADLGVDTLFGFFTPVDKYNNANLASNRKSNESDVLYVNHIFFSDDKWSAHSTDVKATFIHEFQHMVMFDARSRNGLSTNISLWITEGLSMLAEYYGNYGAGHYVYIENYFNVNQGKSLIAEQSQDYGLSYLFMRYLQIRFGDDVIKKIYASSRSGTQMIEDATGMDFNELFLDFTKMILVTGRGITNDTRYNIDEFNGIEGSETYTRNGFNLSEIIDSVYSMNSTNSKFITNSGYSNTLSLYGFQITKWSSPIDILTLNTSSNKINGMYYAW